MLKSSLHNGTSAFVAALSVLTSSVVAQPGLKVETLPAAKSFTDGTMSLKEGVKLLLDGQNSSIQSSTFLPSTEYEVALPFDVYDTTKDYAPGVFFAMLDEAGAVIYETIPNLDPNSPYLPTVKAAYMLSGGTIRISHSPVGEISGDFTVDGILMPADTAMLYKRGKQHSEVFLRGLKAAATPLEDLREKFNSATNSHEGDAFNLDNLLTRNYTAAVTEEDGTYRIYPSKDATVPLDAGKLDFTKGMRVLLLSDIKINPKNLTVRARGHVVTDPKIILFALGQEAMGITNWIATRNVLGAGYKTVQFLSLRENKHGSNDIGFVDQYVLDPASP